MTDVATIWLRKREKGRKRTFIEFMWRQIFLWFLWVPVELCKNLSVDQIFTNEISNNTHRGKNNVNDFSNSPYITCRNCLSYMWQSWSIYNFNIPSKCLFTIGWNYRFILSISSKYWMRDCYRYYIWFYDWVMS
jgi:hypothetical protein